MSILRSVCIHLQHYLSFPDLCPFFLRLIYHPWFCLSFNLWYKDRPWPRPIGLFPVLCRLDFRPLLYLRPDQAMATDKFFGFLQLHCFG